LSPFCEKENLKKEYSVKIFPLLKKIIQTKMKKILQKIATMAYKKLKKEKKKRRKRQNPKP